jgi:radical SAM superfamily enzyme YgiQ (UPF0313 family)
MLDILLVHPYFIAEDAQERRIMRPYPPLGVLSLAAWLKQRGFAVGVFDGTFQTFDAFLAALVRDRPRVVGVSINLMTKRQALRMIAAARDAGARVVVGGPDPPAYAAEYLDAGADVVAIGEGEQTAEELLRLWTCRDGHAGLPRRSALEPDRAKAGRLNDIAGIAFKGEGGQVVRTAPRPLLPDLDALPLPDRDSIDVAQYLQVWRRHHGAGSLSLITARGCPFTCTWCSRSVYGETHRRRSPGAVADEVAMLADRYRPDRLWYADDVFTIHRGGTLKSAAELARRGLRLPFECISRAERIDDEVAEALRSSGCARVWLGSESGSQRVLDAMKRRMTTEQVRDATTRLQKRGIEVGLFIMLGYEGEDRRDLRATIEHLKRTGADTFLTTLAYPIKGTPYYDAVRDRVVARQPWPARTDRDLVVAGRQSRRYYDFARRWMTGEVARHQHWARQRYARAVRAAASSLAGRIGMALTARQVES